MERYRADLLKGLEHTKRLHKKETERIRAKGGKETHAEQLHYWDGKVNGLQAAYDLLTKKGN